MTKQEISNLFIIDFGGSSVAWSEENVLYIEIFDTTNLLIHSTVREIEEITGCKVRMDIEPMILNPNDLEWVQAYRLEVLI